jgi:hypothetical protein
MLAWHLYKPLTKFAHSAEDGGEDALLERGFVSQST